MGGLGEGKLGSGTLGDPLAASPPPAPQSTAAIPKLKVPLQFGRTGLQVVEQGSTTEIAACVYALLSTPRGSRLEESDYGVEGTAFEQFPPDEALDEWLTQIEIWEPRANVKTAADLEALFTDVEVAVGVSP